MGVLFDDLAETYKAIADKTRLHILALLCHDTLCVCELVAVLEMSQPAVSQHLQRLKRGGLVTEERRGSWVYYAVNELGQRMLEPSAESLPDVSHELAWLEQMGLRVMCQSPRQGVIRLT